MNVLSSCLRRGLWGLLICLGCASRPAVGPARAPLDLPANAWSPDQQALHVLRRLAFGPSARDWEEVKRQGVAAWIQGQLHPESLPDEALRARLAALPTLAMSMETLAGQYPPLQEQARELGMPLRDEEDKARLKEMLGPEALPQRVLEELVAQKLIRAVEGRHQLEEVLVDFWFNHFNVSADKGRVRWMVTSYERDAVRPHVFGHFRELLAATAHHPAMLFYLDNWRSAREGFVPRGKGRDKDRQPTGLNENYARELLELHTLGVEGGYSQQDVREVARAFTGWTIDKPQKDPAFVFRAAMHDDGAKHVLGQELPAGGGVDEGERVLDLLARHPATARFIATQLARKFVSDEPPPALVARLAGVFQRTEGDLRAVYTALFTSPEFWSDRALGSQTKTPLELVASSLRALGATTEGGPALTKVLERLGQPLYRAPAPTGFPEQATPWVNTGALVLRIDFALDLASGRMRGTDVDPLALLPTPRPLGTSGLVAALAPRLLFAPLSSETRTTVMAALAPGETGQEPGRRPDGEVRPADLRRAVGLLLGSPEFQQQ